MRLTVEVTPESQSLLQVLAGREEIVDKHHDCGLTLGEGSVLTQLLNQNTVTMPHAQFSLWEREETKCVIFFY